MSQSHHIALILRRTLLQAQSGRGDVLLATLVYYHLRVSKLNIRDLSFYMVLCEFLKVRVGHFVNPTTKAVYITSIHGEFRQTFDYVLVELCLVI